MSPLLVRQKGGFSEDSRNQKTCNPYTVATGKELVSSNVKYINIFPIQETKNHQTTLLLHE